MKHMTTTVFPLGLAAVLVGPTVAGTINVPVDEPTIQAAVDVAVDGDEVVVADGIWVGAGNRDLDFAGRAITVRSANGPASCTINCQGSSLAPHRGFHFHTGESADSVVDGFTITNGYTASASPGIDAGGAIICQAASPTIANCIIRNNLASDGCDLGGGGIAAIEASNPTITDCVIRNNAVVHPGCTGGGGLSIIDSGATITGSSITGNTAKYGGGMWVQGGGGFTLTIDNCVISGNTADMTGGGARIGAVEMVLTNNTITENTVNGTDTPAAATHRSWTSARTSSRSPRAPGTSTVTASSGSPTSSTCSRSGEPIRADRRTSTATAT